MNDFKFIGFSAKNEFGIELEVNKAVSQKTIQSAIVSADGLREVYVSGYEKTRDNDFWHVKTDSTCGDLGYKKDTGGWEIASYVARGFKDIKNIGNVVVALKAAGARVNKNCGLHIHVNIEHVDPNTVMYNLLANWIRIEHIIYEMVPAHRRTNIYCLPLRNKIGIANDSSNILNTSFSRKIATNTNKENDRRVGLNICNYMNGGMARTVELRLPEGSLNHNTIKHWIRFFVHFVHNNCRKLETVDKTISLRQASLNETLHILGLQGNEDFYILSRYLRLTKIWFLKRILRHSNKPFLVSEAKKVLSNMI